MDPLLNFMIFLGPYSRLQRFFCSDLELNRGGFVWGGIHHGNLALPLSARSEISRGLHAGSH